MAQLTWMQQAEHEFERKLKEQQVQWDRWYEDTRWKAITGQLPSNGLLSQITINEPAKTLDQGHTNSQR